MRPQPVIQRAYAAFSAHIATMTIAERIFVVAAVFALGFVMFRGTEAVEASLESDGRHPVAVEPATAISAEGSLWTDHRGTIVLVLAFFAGQAFCVVLGWQWWSRRMQAQFQQTLDVAREAEQRRVRAMVAAGVVTWEWDLTTDRVEIDRGFRALPGFAETGQPSFDWRQLVHPDDVAGVLARITTGLQGSAASFAVEHRSVQQAGPMRWFSARGIVERDSTGRAVRVIGIHTDITERRQIEEAARESERRFQYLAEVAPVLIWMSGPDKLRTSFSKGWQDFTGCDAADATGTRWTETIHPEDRMAAISAYLTAFDARLPFTMEFRARRHDGQYRWILDSGVPRYGADGEFLGYIGCGLDITDRKNDEAELQQSRQELVHLSRVSSMGALSSALAHELNQPLGAILSNAQAALRFLRHEPAILDEVTEILEDIVSEDQRAGEIIQRMRQMLRRGQPQYLPLDLNQLVNEVLWLMRSEMMHRQTKVELVLAHDLQNVLGDRVPLQQVLINLLFNGSDAMQHLPPAERRLIVRTSQRQNVEIGLDVSDCGVGLRTDDLRGLFTPFFTTKKQGLGVGLAICKSIMDSHGGRIWAENNPDRGATFHIVLPIADEPATANKAVAATSAAVPPPAAPVEGSLTRTDEAAPSVPRSFFF